MSNGYQILLGTGLAVSVSLMAILGLPKLADASSTLKDQARWQTRAVAFQNTDITTAPSSSMVALLADNQLDTTITNPYMLDFRTGMESVPSAQDMIANSKSMGREVQCLSEAVYYEARSETRSGQMAVAEVVLNRVKSKHFPNTICGVVYEGAERTTGCQFSFACDGSTSKLPYGRYWEKSQQTARHMFIGASAPMTRRATHYHTTEVSPKWAPLLRETRQYDTHVFYRFMPRKIQLRRMSVAP